MSNMDDLITGINSSRRNPRNKELWEFIKNSLEQIKEINENYKKLFKGTEDKSAIISEIEEKLGEIKKNYNHLFLKGETGKSRIGIIKEKIEEIKQYHRELLQDSDDEKSIKTDIEESKGRINEFYNYLFYSKDEKETNEEKTKKSIKQINEFNEKIFDEEKGLEKEIDNAYNRIIEKHSSLFESADDKKSKIQQLNENIDNINKFNSSLENEIKPSLDKKQGYLEELQTDIDTKRDDIQSLLTSATLGALTQGYQESKEEYSNREKLKYRKVIKKIDIFSVVPFNFFAFVFNTLLRYSVSVLNYTIFVLPLLFILVLFIQPEWGILKNFNKLLENLNGSNFDNFIFFRVALSFPLLWISWFGQRNISQRKRLFEEYNHKLRVVQMYRMFNDNEKSYDLDNKAELESILLKVIRENPAKHLGSGDTIIDKILEKFKLEGFYKKLKEEIITDIQNIVKIKEKTNIKK